MSKMKLNFDANIGKVVFIVEGPKTEIYILKKILRKLFGYELVIKRNNHKSVELYETSGNILQNLYN